MQTVYLLVLIVMLLLIVGVGAYEGFNASSGGALTQLTTSHVSEEFTSDEDDDDDEVKQVNPDTNQVDGMTNMDNTPYAPY